MMHPFLHVLTDGRRSNFSGHLLVINHGRSQAARTQTAGREQRNFLVSSGLPRENAKIALHSIQQLRRSLDVARCAHADDTGMLARGFQGEEMVESSDAVGSAQ